MSTTTEESVQQVEVEIPLTAEQFLDLGRVTAVLSQIDTLLTEALSNASKTPAWAAYIFADKATMSGKITMLDQIVRGLENTEVKSAGKKLVTKLHKINGDRNTLFHGIWVYHYDPKKQRGFPACIWQKQVIRPSELPDIATRAASLSREIGAFLALVNPKFASEPRPRRLFIATENVDLDKLHPDGVSRASE